MTKSKYKNYYIGVVIALMIILAILYYLKIYETARLKKYEKSYLVDNGAVSLTINSLDEIKQVFSEAPESYFVFISYTKDETEYKLENRLKPIIDSYELKDSFYYLNTNDIKDDNDLYDKINDKFKLTKDKINSIPIIIYFKEGSYEIVDPNKLDSFLEKNNFEKVSH